MHAKTLIGNSFQRTKNCAQNGQHRWNVTVTSCIIKSYNKWPRVQFITVPDGQVALKVFDDTFVFFGLSIAEVEHILS